MLIQGHQTTAGVAPQRRFSAPSPVVTAPEAAPPAESFTPSQAPPPVGVDKKSMRKALGSFPTGVTVVTTGSGEDRRGMTASSFNSVSLDPPLVLFSAGNESSTLAAIRENGSFVINLLAQDQNEVSQRFSQGSHTERFAGQAARAGNQTGAPVLEGTLGHFECEVHQIVPAGDHNIVIGRVVGLEQAPEGQPLAFWGGRVQNAEGWLRK